MKFLNYLNSRHPNIKFTFETKLNGKLPFLDVLVDIRIIFSSFKIKNFFSFKDPIPDALKSLVVYQFTCAGCNSRYIGETSRHFATRVKEHLSSDKNSHVYKHLNGSPSCKHKCSVDCFKIVDSAKTRHCLKLKEAIYISRLKPELNAQLQHNNDFCFL